MLVTSPAVVRAVDSVHVVSVPGETSDIDFARYRGKVLYVDFWASWCVPYLKSFPWMNAMQEKYQLRGLQIIAINLDKERSLSRKFLEKTRPVFPIGYDKDADLARQFEVVGMPNSFLFDGDGQLISSHVGFRNKDRDAYEAALVAALNALPGNE